MCKHRITRQFQSDAKSYATLFAVTELRRYAYEINTIKISLTAIIFVLLVGCSKNESLAFMMEASFTEQFSYACNENTKCIEATESNMDICFNKELAVAAIEANKIEKKKINTKHILEMQKCLSQKSGKDYWKEIDMPNFILSQVN